jgi:hypothetical protein
MSLFGVRIEVPNRVSTVKRKILFTGYLLNSSCACGRSF